MPPTPPSLVRFAAKVASVIAGSSTSSPTSDHVPALMYAEPGARNGIARDRRGGVVRADRDDGRRAEAGLGGDVGRERAEPRAGLDELGQEPRRDVEPFEQVARPRAGAGVEALRRRRVRPLADARPREPVVEEVGDHQQRLGGVERRVVVGRHRGELEDGVDRHELDPGALVQLAGRDALERRAERRRAPVVAVVHRVPDEAAAPVEEPEVDAPGVDPDRVDAPAVRAGGAEAVEHVAVQRRAGPSAASRGAAPAR